MWKATFLVLLGAGSFGVLSTFVKLAYGAGYTLGEITGTQALFGAAFLWLFYWLSKPKRKKQVHISPTKPWKIMLGGVSTGAVSVVYYQCVHLVPASLAIILLMQFVWMSMVLEFLFYRQKPSKTQLFATAMVLLGTLAASGFLENQLKDVSVEGIAYGLLAALCYAIFLLVNNRIGIDYHPLHKSALMISGACLFIFIVLPPYFILQPEKWMGLSKWALVLAIFGTVIPPICFAKGFPKTGIGLGSILSSVELPVAVAMSALVLKEQVSLWQWLGVVVLLAAIVLPKILTLTGSKRG